MKSLFEKYIGVYNKSKSKNTFFFMINLHFYSNEK